MSLGTRLPALLTLVASAILAIAVGAAPAQIVNGGCSPPSCSYYVPSISVPGGWVHDSAAEAITAGGNPERQMQMQILVPDGNHFTATDRFIMASALPKPANQTIADFMKSTEAGGTLHHAGIRFIHLPDLSRGNDKEPFHLLLIEKPESTRFELSALTIATDRNGQAHFVTIWLSTDEVETLNATIPQFQAILSAF